MNFSTKKLPKSKLEIKINVTAEELKSFKEQAILGLGKDLDLAGFRKGRAPRKIVEESLGAEKILSAAAEMAIKENYIKIVSENSIEALGQPEIEILTPLKAENNDAAGLEFLAVISVMPEVNLPDYKKIAAGVKKNKPEVSEKETEDALRWLQKSRAKFTLKEGFAEKGDWIEIEYSIKPANLPEGGDSQITKDAFVLGDGRFAAGFEENLIGIKAGEEKNFILSGKQQSTGEKVWVRVISVQKMELAELNDEFARNLGKFENLVALKQNIRNGIKAEKEREETQKFRQEILDQIVEKSKMEIPDILVEWQKNKYFENFKNDVREKLQMNLDDYLKKIKKTEEEIIQSIRGSALAQVKNSLVLREIQKKENILVSPEEVEKEISEFLKSSPDAEKMNGEIDQKNLRSYTEEIIKQEKTFARLDGTAIAPPGE